MLLRYFIGGLFLALSSSSRSRTIYPAYFAEMFPGVFAIFMGVIIYLALKLPDPRENALRASVFAVVTPLLAIGLISRWGGVRYLIGSYPFLLLVAAWGSVQIFSFAIQRLKSTKKHAVLLFATIVVLSGILGGHGIPQAIRVTTLRYGESVDRFALGLPFYLTTKTPEHM